MKHYTDEHLIDYLHGELPAGMDAQVHAHLAMCSDCHVRYEAEAALGDMLRAAAQVEEREFPSIIKAKVWAAIRDEQPSLLARLRAFVRPIVVVPVAAAFAVLMYVGVPVIRGSYATGSPTVAAAFYLEEHAAEGQETPLADHGNGNVIERSPAYSTAPLIDAADAATLDDVAPSN